MKTLFQKLTSRKLWMAIAGIGTGIAVVLGADGSEINTIAGAVVSLISAIAYIVIEGKIDAERIKTAIEDVQDAVNVIEGSEK
jgi:hypothetical protein